MKDVLEALKGKKTNLAAAAGALLVFLYNAGLLDKEAFDVLVQLDIFAGLAALRAGVKCA